MTTVVLGEEYKQDIVLALGFFDCLHVGHQKIIALAKELSVQNNCQCALFTFSNNFLKVVGRKGKLLYTFEERLSLADKYGLDVIVSAYFDDEFMRLSSDEFLNKLAQLNIKGFVCGEDYTFGSNRANVQVLEDYCRKNAIKLEISPDCLYNGQRISATQIKKYLASNELDKVNHCLNRCFSVSGEVIKGRGVGVKIGFPTANIAVDPEKMLPMGVYKGYGLLEGKKYNAVINSGSKPTFELENYTLEAHFIGYKGNLYNQIITVYFESFIRGIHHYESVEKLIEQIQKDVESVKNGS